MSPPMRRSRSRGGHQRAIRRTDPDLGRRRHRRHARRLLGTRRRAGAAGRYRAEHVEACRTTGLDVSGPIEEFTQVIPAVTPAELTGHLQAHRARGEGRRHRGGFGCLGPHLAADGYVLSAQNGLNEIAIAEAVGAERTMGCFVNFGADWHGPGEILYGNRGAVVVRRDRWRGSTRAHARRAPRCCSVFEPDAILTDNIWGYLWGKLAYGAMLFATALTDESMSANFADPGRLPPLWLALGREVVAVAAARGVTPLGFGDFDPTASRPARRERRRSRPSPGSPTTPRRPPRPIPASGATSPCASARPRSMRRSASSRRSAREAGVATPALETLVALIHEIEDGAARSPRIPARC